MRGKLGTITDVVRSVVAPAALIADQAETAIVEVPNPARPDEVDEIPPVAPPTRPAALTAASAPRRRSSTSCPPTPTAQN
ncbi:hypothetical protein [Streptomyces canus]|uniref:hypothetical protein n=1 Tax=Streptomyces canus TaxID=58343 RepID=UPI0036E4C148